MKISEKWTAIETDMSPKLNSQDGKNIIDIPIQTSIKRLTNIMLEEDHISRLMKLENTLLKSFQVQSKNDQI